MESHGPGTKARDWFGSLGRDIRAHAHDLTCYDVDLATREQQSPGDANDAVCEARTPLIDASTSP